MTESQKAGAVLWFLKEHGPDDWMTVAVEVDAEGLDGNVIALGTGASAEASKEDCVKMMVELGRTEEPGEIVWTAPPSTEGPSP